SSHKPRRPEAAPWREGPPPWQGSPRAPPMRSSNASSSCPLRCRNEVWSGRISELTRISVPFGSQPTKFRRCPAEFLLLFQLRTCRAGADYRRPARQGIYRVASFEWRHQERQRLKKGPEAFNAFV